MNKKQLIQTIFDKVIAPLSVGEVADSAQVSRVYASRILNKLLDDGVLKSERDGTRIYYSRRSGKVFLNQQFRAAGLQEDVVLDKVRRNETFSAMVSEAARSAFEFAFPEMLNNAIEHSQSQKIDVIVRVMEGKLAFVIRDYGVGVFRNVRKEKRLPSEYDATREILKGKNTTAPRAHSGMGIFFTAKIADILTLNSYEVALEIDNIVDDIFIRDLTEEVLGTEVRFEIDANTTKSVTEIFNKYAIDPEEGDFDRTEIAVKLYKIGAIYVSRSQARALLSGLDKFKHVILDFADVENIGQAFADQIFRVYAMTHPEIKIDYINANRSVEFMIKLAKNGLEA